MGFRKTLTRNLSWRGGGLADALLPGGKNPYTFDNKVARTAGAPFRYVAKETSKATDRLVPDIKSTLDGLTDAVRDLTSGTGSLLHQTGQGIAQTGSGVGELGKSGKWLAVGAAVVGAALLLGGKRGR